MKDGVESKMTDKKGMGVFAMRQFCRGEVVVQGVIERELSGNTDHATQVARDRYVLHAGLNPIVNHSCDPNCGIRVNETGGHDIVAMQTIEPGEEITYDYAMRNYEIKYIPECFCGKALCRGAVTGWRDLPPETREKYTGFVAPYLYEIEF